MTTVAVGSVERDANASAITEFLETSQKRVSVHDSASHIYVRAKGPGAGGVDAPE